MMPITLTLIRHGESESNAAESAYENKQTLKGTYEVAKVHTSERRLTKLGVCESKEAGKWLRKWKHEIGLYDSQFRFYVSPYVRAAETATNMGLGMSTKWRMDVRVVERNWGFMDQESYDGRMEQYKDQFRLRKEFAFFWRPGDGETIQDVHMRVRDFIKTLHRECSNMHVIVVTHGETMWAFRFLLEHWLPQDLRAAMLNRTGQTDLHNCRIIQYTRIPVCESRPRIDMYPRMKYMRMVNPMKPNDPEHNLPWTEIGRKDYSDADLAEYVDKHPRFLCI